MHAKSDTCGRLVNSYTQKIINNANEDYHVQLQSAALHND